MRYGAMDAWLRKLPYWSALRDSEKSAVADAAVLRKYPAGSLLHDNCDGGASCLGMIFVLSGKVMAYIVSDAGREISLFSVGAGDCCVLSASCVIPEIRFDCQFAVTEDAEILMVPTSALGKLMQENLLVRCFLYERIAERFSTVMEVVQQMLFSRFDQRLAAFFLGEYRKTGSARICMTQEQIARNVNSAREVVARTLKQFAAAGLVENRRGVILLKDIKGLEKLNNKA